VISGGETMCELACTHLITCSISDDTEREETVLIIGVSVVYKCMTAAGEVGRLITMFSTYLLSHLLFSS